MGSIFSREVNVIQANQLTLKSYPGVGPLNTSGLTDNVSGIVSRWLNRLLGCWHLEMSRPFSSEGQAYRVCLSCGAQRRFNLKNWEMQGDFYYTLPTSKHFRALQGLAAVRRVKA